ncbi:MAG TPA: sigma factor-like helix-turn-helix DNA-binding protein [Puia sp.]|nr:sigma factor-like helix-turn-helix DNA-binding protein [Puia sp.]
MRFNSNKERSAYWEEMCRQYSESAVKQAIDSLKQDTQEVLHLHYGKGHSLSEIATIMNKSITVIRNHHNRGIFKLHRYFNRDASENV